MMLIKTRIGPSRIQGIGLFADQDIKKGTAIWRFTPGFDLKFTDEQIKRLPPRARKYIIKYSWKSDRSHLRCFSLDDGKYFNHSDNPNALSRYYDGEEEVVTKVIRDIKKGEEITDNYRSFESTFRKPKNYK